MKRFALIIIACVASSLPCAGQSIVDGFVAKIHENADGQSMPYRLFIPRTYDKAQKYPLVLWLHGSGSVGTDNLKQISGPSLRGTHIWTSPENQARHPAFVVAPQSTKAWAGGQLTLTLEILSVLQSGFSIDPDRIYVAGQSMGGYGAWNLITTKPDLFAAAIPLCGGGNPAQASLIARIPIWAFHGAADPTVPVAQSRNMIDALRKSGGTPRYTEYKGVGHNVWVPAFKEPAVVDWLFAQRR